MDLLPDEIILPIISFITTSEWQLFEIGKVSRKLNRLIQNQRLWYQLFRFQYENWGHNVPYAYLKPLIDWRGFVIHLRKQKRQTDSFQFDFVSDELITDSVISRKRKLHELARSSSSPSPPSSYKHTTSSQLQQQQQTLLPNLPLMDIDMTASSSSSSSSYSSSNTIGSSSYNHLSSIVIPEISFDRESLRNNHYNDNNNSNNSNNNNNNNNNNNPSHHNHHQSPPFRIQDPLVVDIDRVTNTGIVATGKHRKLDGNQQHRPTKRSEHKILFWEYPSWKLIRELEISIVTPEITCQIVGIQSIRTGSSSSKIRLFALAIGLPAEMDEHLDDEGNHDDNGEANEDRMDIWQAVLIYRLYDNGVTQCLAHIPFEDDFLGREVFFFSDYSWTHGDDEFKSTTDHHHHSKRNIKDWLGMIAPGSIDYDPQNTLFMFVIGLNINANGGGKLIQFDLRGNANVVDPALTPVAWDTFIRRMLPSKFYFQPLNEWQQQQQLMLRRLMTENMNNEASSSSSSSNPINNINTITSNLNIPFNNYNIKNNNSNNRNNNNNNNNNNNSGDTDNIHNNHSNNYPSLPIPAKVIYTVHLGSYVSCMIHFKYPFFLNHLICTGSLQSNELSIYDWRFGIKVGTLPWKVAHESLLGRHNHTDDNVLSPPAPPPPTRADQQEHSIHDNRLGDVINIIDGVLGDRILNQDNLEQRQQQQQGLDENNIEDNDNAFDLNQAKPWGLESTMVLPPYWNSDIPYRDELADRGFRLIAVGDNRKDRLEIKVWDISFLLRQLWDPLQYKRDENVQQEKNSQQHSLHNEQSVSNWQNELGWSKLFPWWKYGSQHLRLLGLKTICERISLEDRRHVFSSIIPNRLKLYIKNNTHLHITANTIHLPLSPYGQTMILAHSFYKPSNEDEDEIDVNINNNNDNNLTDDHGNNNSNQSDNNNHMDTTMAPLDNDNDEHENELLVTTVKYTAYNVLYTSLFLLTEDGMVTVLDIETGKVTGTIDNVAAATSTTTSSGIELSNTCKIRGIDVNVVAGNEVVVTSREGLLRSIML
ncbi:unnamed protein product [Cunninghamella echinulata]